MNENAPIIDVNPVDHSSSRIAMQAQPRSTYGGGASGVGGGYTGGARGYAGGASNVNGSVGAGSEASRPWSFGSAAGGLVQMVAGASLILIGIPMLILPGPGLLSIAAGAVLAARGASKLIPR